MTMHIMQSKYILRIIRKIGLENDFNLLAIYDSRYF